MSNEDQQICPQWWESLVLRCNGNVEKSVAKVILKVKSSGEIILKTQSRPIFANVNPRIYVKNNNLKRLLYKHL